MPKPRSNQAALDALVSPRPAMPDTAPEQPNFADYAHWRLVLDRDNALWAILDKKGASTNTLSEAVLRELAGLSTPEPRLIVIELASGTRLYVALTPETPKRRPT